MMMSKMNKKRIEQAQELSVIEQKTIDNDDEFMNINSQLTIKIDTLKRSRFDKAKIKKNRQQQFN